MLSKFIVLLLVVLAVQVSESRPQFGGSAATNSRGGQDVTFSLGKQFGDINRNIGGSIFASGNTFGGPVTRGGFLAANSNGFGASLQHTNTDNFGSIFSQNLNANILKNDNHNLDVNAFHSHTNLDNGFKYNTLGTGLNYNHARGHEVSLSASRIPQLDMNTLDLSGKANLWKSENKATSVDIIGGIFGGPLDGQTNKHIGLGLKSNF